MGLISFCSVLQFTSCDVTSERGQLTFFVPPTSKKYLHGAPNPPAWRSGLHKGRSKCLEEWTGQHKRRNRHSECRTCKVSLRRETKMQEAFPPRLRNKTSNVIKGHLRWCYTGQLATPTCNANSQRMFFARICRHFTLLNRFQKLPTRCSTANIVKKIVRNGVLH